jgi:two-component system sensor histidine kinase YesM
MKKLIDWYYGKASIRFKIISSYLALIILPIAILGIYSFRLSRDNLMVQTQNTMESNVSSIVYNLNENIRRENDNIKYLSYNSSFRDELEHDNTTKLASVLNTDFEPGLWYYLTSDDNLKSICIYSPYVENAVGSFVKPMSALPDRLLYEAHNYDFTTKWYVSDGEIIAARTLLDAATSSYLIGIIRVVVYDSRFIDPIYQSAYLDNGVMLVDGNGTVIAGRDIENDNIQKEISNIIGQNDLEGYYETDDYMLYVSDSLNNGWKLYYYIDQNQISGQLGQILRATGIMVGFCLIIAFLSIGMISRVLSKRILKLEGYAKEVGKGNFDVSIETGHTDEIGVVEESFSSMCKKITQMMDDMYKLGQEKRNEELKALQAMINPHFLSNCLSSIKWKAIRADQDEIADAAGLVARFYKTALNGGDQITTVANELDNIKAYLEIQLKMHDYSYDVVYDLDDDMDYSMPNFLLQPIVENAIVHGIDYNEEVRGMIKIEYRHDGTFLIFRIINNGKKLNRNAIEDILRTQGKGYGLYNIRERIKIFYNDPDCGLYAGVNDDGMTCFTIKLRNEIS